MILTTPNNIFGTMRNSPIYTITDAVNGMRLNGSTFYNINTWAGQRDGFANDLSNGIYTYTLVVDGQIIDTKRMVKSR